MDLHYLSLVVEPLDHLGGLQGLHHAGEVDEAAPGVQEHLGAAEEPGHGVWGESGERSESSWMSGHYLALPDE